MKAKLSVLFSLSVFLGVQLMPGYSCALAQASANQTAGNEFGQYQPQGFSDSQFSLLWNAYNTKSDSLLGKFFNNWRLETQILEEPIIETSVDDAVASLYVFLLNSDFQDTTYPYMYAVIQNQIQASVSSPFSPLGDDYVLTNFHPQLTSAHLPILIILDDRHTSMFGEFLGDWSVDKAETARQFFGKYLPIGADVDYYDQQAGWSLIRHWYYFEFTSDLQEAFVTDEAPSGTDRYTCIIGPDGNWMRVSDQTVVLDQPQASETSYDPGPAPDPIYDPPYPYPPYPPHHPRPPHPVPPVGPPATYSPALPPAQKPPAIGRPRPIPTPIHPTTPSNPIDVGRPQPVTPPPDNPIPPQTPAEPVYPRPASPPVQAAPASQSPADRSAQNPPQGFTPPPAQYQPPAPSPGQDQPRVSPPSPPPAPVDRPREVAPPEDRPAASPASTPPSSPKSTPPADKKPEDQKGDRER